MAKLTNSKRIFTHNRNNDHNNQKTAFRSNTPSCETDKKIRSKSSKGLKNKNFIAPPNIISNAINGCLSKKKHTVKQSNKSQNQTLKICKKPQSDYAVINNNGERLQKFMAAAGIGSRRACEAVILNGRVQMNGLTVTKLGTRVNPNKDTVTIDLQPIAKERFVYILLNKPKGYITTVKDDEGRPTVMALIYGINERIYPVGRLDFNSEGMLLMTNDGNLAQHLMDPDFHVAKVYMVKIHKMPTLETLEKLRNGFRLDGQLLKPCSIELADKGDNPWFRITLIEGKNQQIRRMFAAVGHPVSKLRRIQFGPLADPTLKPGMWRLCSEKEITTLMSI